LGKYINIKDTMESKRQQKYSKLLQKELAEIFQEDVKSLFGSAFITITEVKVSPDLGYAKVYLSFLMVEDKKVELQKVKDLKGKIRGILGDRIKKQVRIIPQLDFYLDETMDHAAKMEQLFEKIKVKSDAGNSDEKDSENN
jgi:ribosome-binding factor A